MAIYKRYLYNDKPAISINDSKFADELAKFKDDIHSGRFTYRFLRCVCGSTNDRTVVERDRLGLFYRNSLCMDCGLVRANPIMDGPSTSLYYDRYYQTLYHTLPGQTPSAEDEFRDTSEFSEKNYLPFVDLKGIKRILMVGCGTGAVLYPFLKAGHECFGVDFCTEKIEYGKRRGLDLTAGHFEALLSKGRKADVVLLFDLLEHLTDLHEEMGKLSALLEDGALAVIGVPDIFRAHLSNKGDLVVDTLYCHNYWFSLPSLVSTMSVFGFEFTGKYDYIGPGNCLVAVFRKNDSVRPMFDRKLAGRTLRRLRLIEFIFRVRSLLHIDQGLDALAGFVRKRPVLKRLAYKIMGKHE